MNIYDFSLLAEMGKEIQHKFINIGWLLLGLYFLWILIYETYTRTGNLEQFLKIIVRIGICGILLTNVNPIRNFFYDTTVSMAENIFPESQVNVFNVPLPKESEDASNEDTSLFNLNYYRISCWMLSVGKFTYFCVSQILFFIMNFCHFIVFIMAPLAIVFFASPQTQNIPIGLLKRFLALCLWPSYISGIYLVIHKITTPKFMIDPRGSVIESLIYLVVLSLLLVAVPLFATQFVNGLWGMAESAIMQNAFQTFAAGPMLAPFVQGKEAITGLASKSARGAGNKMLEKGGNVYDKQIKGRYKYLKSSIELERHKKQKALKKGTNNGKQ